MVSRSDRNTVADVLAGYLSCRCDNFALDEVLSNYWGEHKDPTLDRIAQSLWFTYDDIRWHTVSLSREEWQLYRRCLAYLRTDLELPLAPEADRTDPVVWPFQSRGELTSARPRLSDLGIPRYDPFAHGRPLPPLGLVHWLPVAVVVLSLLAFFWNYLLQR